MSLYREKLDICKIFSHKIFLKCLYFYPKSFEVRKKFVILHRLE